MTAADSYERARQAQAGWARRTLSERLAIMRRFGELVAGRRDRLAGVLTDETHKPITQARNELAGVVPRVEFFVAETERTLAGQTVFSDDGGLREQISFDPLGVILNISAWNYPWFVGVNVIVPALLTGNSVLYKPSEWSTATGRSIGTTLYDAGVPDDVFTVVEGGGEAAQELLEQPVDGVFFTGSYATGVAVARAVADRMIPVQLELGGKDPVYVADDVVDVAAAAAALADGAFYNDGQSCCSVERIYVHTDIHDEFVDLFVKDVEVFRIGDPHDPDTYIGPLTRPQQVALLEDQVRDALDKGATLRTGGHAFGPPGEGWFEPTVLTGVDHGMAVMRDESFGPIIGVQRVTDDAEAVALMNDSDYGLTAGVFSASEQRARRVLESVDTGTAYWNCCDRVSPRVPWSGRHHSGVGTTLSTIGIRAFVRPRGWHLRR